jgi:adhesin/invasin
VIIVVSLLAACDKVPLLAPSGTTITLATDTSIVQANGVARVTATLLESSGTPVQNGTSVTFTTNLGRLAPAEARTVNGVAAVEFQAAGNSGIAEIRAASGGAKPADTANAALKITVGAAAASRISVTATPGTVAASGGSSTIAATVVDTAGNPLRDVPVSFSATFGTLSTAVASTDSSGVARSTLTTNRESVVTVNVGGTGTATGSANATVTVRVNIKPTVTISVSNTPVAGTATSFTVTANPGANGGAPLTRVRVNFGDGTGEQDLGAASGATPVQHVYTRSGTFTVTAIAEDASGESATASTVVVVPFTVALISSRTGSTGNFTAILSPANTAISRFFWTFGDGSSDTTSDSQTSHVYAAPGTYSISVTATSTSGQTASATGTIVIP